MRSGKSQYEFVLCEQFVSIILNPGWVEPENILFTLDVCMIIAIISSSASACLKKSLSTTMSKRVANYEKEMALTAKTMGVPRVEYHKTT